MKNGDKDSPSLQNKLNDVLKSWHKFRVNVDIVLGMKEDTQLPNNFLKKIAQQNLEVLEFMEKVVFWYQDDQNKSTNKQSYQQAVTINKAGRQRMRIQKMTKEWLLIVYGNNELRKKNKKALKYTIDDFDKTLDRLLKGNSEQNILPPPKTTIRKQLNYIQRKWKEYKKILDKYIKKNKRLSSLDLKKVVNLNELLREKMENVVNDY